MLEEAQGYWRRMIVVRKDAGPNRPALPAPPAGAARHQAPGAGGKVIVHGAEAAHEALDLLCEARRNWEMWVRLRDMARSHQSPGQRPGR